MGWNATVLKKKRDYLIFQAVGYCVGGLLASLLMAWGVLALRGSSNAVIESLLSSEQGKEMTWYSMELEESKRGWIFTPTRRAFSISALRRISSSHANQDGWKWEPGKLPRWVRVRDKDSQPGQYLINFSVGWPMRMLSAQISVAVPSHWVVQGGVEVRGIPFGKQTARTSRLILPLTPLVMGVIANMSFFAIIIWLVRNRIQVVRNRYHRLRNLCPHCAYDITGLTTCPECGQEVKQ